MGTGATGVERSASPEEIEREVNEIRDRLTVIVQDLDRRRHELTDWRLQLRRHRSLVIIMAGSVVLLGAGLAAYASWHRRQQRLIPRTTRLRQALTRMERHPERVAVPEARVPQKVLSAVLTSAASALTGTAVRRLLAATA